MSCFSEETGPYNGSIISFTSPGDPSPYETERRFDALGIYFRYFKFRIVFPGEVLWTLTVSLWYPIILFSILPAIWLAKNYFPIAFQRQNTQI